MYHIKTEDKKFEQGWSGKIVSIYKDDEKIGEYTRNYHSFGAETFHPFEKDGKWYAIYSENYTSTSIMSLPDCKNIGGQEKKAGGFCPTDYFIPKYYNYTIPGATEEQLKTIPEENRSWAKLDKTYRIYGEPDDKEEVFYDLDYAFVCGCYWGDEAGGWKLMRLDLSEADKGIIKQSEDFGYLHLSSGRLKDLIEISDEWGDASRLSFTLSVLRHYNIKDGKAIRSKWGEE
jgi:hypothetical protein